MSRGAKDAYQWAITVKKRTEIRLYIILKSILDFQITPITEIIRITSETFRSLQHALAFSYQGVHSVPPPFFLTNLFLISGLLTFWSMKLNNSTLQSIFLSLHFFSHFLQFGPLFTLDDFLQVYFFYFHLPHLLGPFSS